jgi:hypothetical protein
MSTLIICRETEDDYEYTKQFGHIIRIGLYKKPVVDNTTHWFNTYIDLTHGKQGIPTIHCFPPFCSDSVIKNQVLPNICGGSHTMLGINWLKEVHEKLGYPYSFPHPSSGLYCILWALETFKEPVEVLGMSFFEGYQYGKVYRGIEFWGEHCMWREMYVCYKLAMNGKLKFCNGITLDIIKTRVIPFLHAFEQEFK